MSVKNKQASSRTKPGTPSNMHVRTKAAAPHRVRHAIKARRSLSKQIIMHPLALFGLLILGVLLMCITYRAVAAEYDVLARVEAAQLQFGSVITSPIEGEVSRSDTFVVKGTCSDDSYIKLSRNGVSSGTAICVDGTFSIVTSLAVGSNVLQAQAYTITDQPGPVTPSVTVTYVPSKSTAPNARMITETDLPFLLINEYKFTVTFTGSDFETTLQYSNGTPAIKTEIDWGDGSKTLINVMSNDPFKISHRYEASGYYVINVTGTDSKNKIVKLQLVAYVKDLTDAPTAGPILPIIKNQPPSTKGESTPMLFYAWPIYVVVIVMVLSFWLGERREYLKLTKQGTTKGSHKRRINHA